MFKSRSIKKNRKKGNAKPRSRDSGVSCKFNNNVNLKNCNAVRNDIIEETDIKSEDSYNLKYVPEFVNKQRSDNPNIATFPERNQLALDEDEFCLDYEPFEEEVNNNAFSTLDAKDSEKNKIVNEEKITDNLFAFRDNCNESNEPNMLKSKDSFINPDISCSYSNYHDDSTLVKKSCKYNDKDIAIESNTNLLIDEAILNEDLDEQSKYNENNQLLLYEKHEQESNNYSFGNAKVNFNGPLNITITRSVTNNFQTKVSSKNLSNVPMVQKSDNKSSNVQIYDVTSLVPEEKINLREIKRSISNSQNISSNEISNYEVESCRGMLKDSKIWVENRINTNYIRLPRIASDTDLNKHGNHNSISNSNTSLGSYGHQNPPEEKDGKIQRISVELEDSPMSRYIGDESRLQESYEDDFVARWLMYNSKDYFISCLDSLCESYFTTVCQDVCCSKTHSLEKIKKIVEQSTPQELKKLYEIALKKDVWFMWLFDIFLDYFSVTPTVDGTMLINMIDDVYTALNSILMDKTIYIVKIIECLKKIGFSFKRAVKDIILRYGTSQLWICDILLFLIAKQPNLEENWSLVEKIICYRKEKIDHEVVTELLFASSKNYPSNKELHKKIYNEIFKKNLVDFNKIPHHLREMIIGQSETNLEVQANNCTSTSIVYYTQGVDPKEQKHESFNRQNLDDHQMSESGNETSSMDSSDGVSNEGVDGFFYNQTSSDQDTSRSCLRFSEKKRKLKLKRAKRNIRKVPTALRTIKEKVLQKVIESSNKVPKSYLPANIIAHPSCQPIISPYYQCNVSLHNLFPDVHGWSSTISTADLRRLRSSLFEMNLMEFLDVLESYKDQYTIENFIVTVLTLLKSMGSLASYSTFMSLLNALEERDPELLKQMHVKVSFEVLALNLIYMLGVRGRWDLCRNILLKMKDWHNLITSKIFLLESKQDSHMRRYIDLMNILIQAEDFFWVNEIFQSEVLNFLGPASTWPFNYKPSDTEARNEALKFFLEKVSLKNIFITNDLLKSIAVSHGDSVEEFQVWTWFDNKILCLMKEESSNKSILLFFLNDIVNYFEKYMDKFVFQAYMLHIQHSIRKKEALELFKICCNKGLYHKYTGQESVMLVTTDLTDFEITSLLHCYFENSRRRHVPSCSFHIKLVLPETDTRSLEVMEKYRTHRNVYQVFERICSILEIEFNIRNLKKQSIKSKIYVPSLRDTRF